MRTEGADVQVAVLGECESKMRGEEPDITPAG